MIITNFHHWGLAEWLDKRAKQEPQDELTASISWDEKEDVCNLDLYNSAGQHLESFCYMRKEEILDDLNESSKQFNLKIEMI